VDRLSSVVQASLAEVDNSAAHNAVVVACSLVEHSVWVEVVAEDNPQ
jgi:hypothetical protein